MPDLSADSTQTLTISRLGQRGDGISHGATGTLFVPFTLPGETVSVLVHDDRGWLESIIAASPERKVPECPLFMRCGGCVAQHMGESIYASWKQQNLADTFERTGLSVSLASMVAAHGEGRRRATFHARMVGSELATRDVEVGFMAARSHEIVPVDACPVLSPGMRDAPRLARALAGLFRAAGKPLDIQITASEAGFDVDIRGHGPAGDKLRMILGEAARRLDLARLSLHGDIVVERRPPQQRMGKAMVTPGPGGFLQATALGEESIAQLVRAAMPKAKRVADLFAGCGPFALRLAEAAEVHAVESDGAAMLALDRAFRNTQGLRRVTTETRDLFRRPLLEPELNAFDAVVLDPPRAGAEAQVRWLAASKVPVIAYVSCDPASFARDAKVLVEGGYALESVAPVDQFRYSAHIELVGIFRKGKQKK